MTPDAPGLGAPRRKNFRRPGVAAAQRRVIPFDYAFRFALTGEPGTTRIEKIEVSIEAAFTAVSIGYGVVPEVQPVVFGVAPKAILNPGSAPSVPSGPALVALTSSFKTSRIIEAGASPFAFVTQALAEALGENVRVVNGLPIFGPVTARALRNGFRLNPALAETALTGGTRSTELGTLERYFQVVAPPPEQVQFKYALFDDGSGREFQSEPILNTAGLGAADGSRPFRYFARPIDFAPRSVIRMQITEVSDFRGELHVSLQGYKVLGGAGSPTGRSA